MFCHHLLLSLIQMYVFLVCFAPSLSSPLQFVLHVLCCTHKEYKTEAKVGEQILHV